MTPRFPRTSVLVPILVAALCLPAAAQILELDSDSLTSYLPSGSTSVQDVRPIAAQRGTNIDGSLRSAPGLLMQVAGNPFGEVWTGKQSQGDVRIDIGAYAPFDVDIALPATGPRWIVGRSYNPRQEDSEGSHRDSGASPQGVDWFQTSQPEILLYEHPTDDDKDVLYLIYGADRFVEFKRVDEESVEFKGVNGAAGVFVPGPIAANQALCEGCDYSGVDASGGSQPGDCIQLTWEFGHGDPGWCKTIFDDNGSATGCGTRKPCRAQVTVTFDCNCPFGCGDQSGFEGEEVSRTQTGDGTVAVTVDLLSPCGEDWTYHFWLGPTQLALTVLCDDCVLTHYYYEGH
jgi:hypothetical protein